MKALTSDPSSCVVSLFHRAVWCWTVRPPGSHTEPARWPQSSSLSFASPPSSAPPCVSHIPCGGTRKQAAQRGFNPLLFSSYYICNSGMFTSTLMLHEWNQVIYLFQWNHKCRIILKKTTCSTAQSAKHFIKQTVAFLCLSLSYWLLHSLWKRGYVIVNTWQVKLFFKERMGLILKNRLVLSSESNPELIMFSVQQLETSMETLEFKWSPWGDHVFDTKREAGPCNVTVSLRDE